MRRAPLNGRSQGCDAGGPPTVVAIAEQALPPPRGLDAADANRNPAKAGRAVRWDLTG